MSRARLATNVACGWTITLQYILHNCARRRIGQLSVTICSGTVLCTVSAVANGRCWGSLVLHLAYWPPWPNLLSARKGSSFLHVHLCSRKVRRPPHQGAHLLYIPSNSLRDSQTSGATSSAEIPCGTRASMNKMDPEGNVKCTTGCIHW